MMLGAALSTLWAGCSGPGKGGQPEICKNGVDDDGDGDADCADAADCSFLCGEVCTDGVDNDADGRVDCADPGCDGQCAETCDDGRDNDLDGLADCLDPEDCGAVCPEVCDDEADNDGDSKLDCADEDCLTTCDGDGDGFLSLGIGGDDCDDGNAAVHPGADELCNGIDDDCDALTDDEDAVTDGEPYWFDDDGDGFGNSHDPRQGCVIPANGIGVGDDCDDGDGNVNPDAPEVCSGKDDDCDGLTDEDDPSLDLDTMILWYDDGDGDGYGVPSNAVQACVQPSGKADNTDDCDDSDPDVGGPVLWALDSDDDGYGGSTSAGPDCNSPGASYVPASLGFDCNDANPAISPAAVDTCGDGVDQDCEDGDFLGCYDTAAFLGMVGTAEVDEVAGTYAGTEVYSFVGQPSGWLICEWNWTMLDWAHDPSVVGVNPISTGCIDPDGFACDWAFTVHESNGVMTDGDDCAFYGLTPITTNGATLGYGWTDAYHAAGINYGPTMMYFLAPYTVWVGLHPAALFPHTESYDQGTGQFDYTWDEFALLPTT
jgi:hypothetical protein